MKDAVMSFAAREEIDSVPNCAAHLKANGEFVLILFFVFFNVLQLFFILFKCYRRQCNYCMKIYRLLVRNVSAIINRSLSISLSMQITQLKPKKFLFQDIFQVWRTQMRYSTKTARNKGFLVLFKSKGCEYRTQCSSSFTLFLLI